MRNSTKKFPGFFMTEFMVYLVLSGLLAVFVMRYIFGTLLELRATTQRTDRIAALYTCLDAVAHDIEQAPCAVTDWKTLQEDELAWQKDQAKICWRVHEGKLQRRIQKFNVKEQRWKRPVTHVAFEQVAHFYCTPHYNAPSIHPAFFNKMPGTQGERYLLRLRALTVSITAQMGAKQYTCKQTVPLHQKVVS